MKSQFTYFRKLICLVFFGWVSTTVLAQEADSSGFHLLREIKVQSEFFTTDKLGQFYIVRPDDQLIKYSASGDSLFQFNNHRNGLLEIVDVTDPFNILLFYPEFMKVLTLDRTLSPASSFDLYDLDIIDIPAIGMSNDNNIWIYDNTSFTLKKFNRNGKLMVESEQMSFQLKTWLQPNFILDRGNFIFLNDPTQGIFLFDLFGKYIKTLDIKDLHNFQVEENRLIYQKEQHLIVFDLITLNELKIPLPIEVEAADQVQVSGEFLFVKQENRILVYQF